MGTLLQRGDRTRFSLDPQYRQNPDRPVLGLSFEQNLNAVHVATLRVPPWFSNLLPEGRLREWIAVDRGVSAQREMELLAQVGHDLPGAVRVLPEDEVPAGAWDSAPGEETSAGAKESLPGWRFSLAGVALKFSMLRRHDRLTLPAFGEGGDWIVKLPDSTHQDVPRNEHAMMSLASDVGIDIPEVMLVHRTQLEGLPEDVWPEREEWAYAVRRFDRGPDRSLVHIEDLAQVRGFFPNDKYVGTFETVASLIYRRRDVESLLEFVRRLTFNVLISNGDSHLKNWSLIYPDGRIPRLSPAYDLVSTAYYRHGPIPEDLGLKLAGTKAFHQISLGTFAKLGHRLGARVDLPGCAAEVVERTLEAWPARATLLDSNKSLQNAIDASITARSRTLMRKLQ